LILLNTLILLNDDANDILILIHTLIYTLIQMNTLMVTNDYNDTLILINSLILVNDKSNDTLIIVNTLINTLLLIEILILINTLILIKYIQ